MKLVKIRKENEGYLLYFPSERLSTEVNLNGAIIAHRFFNEERGVEEISIELLSRYPSKTYVEIKEDVEQFLKDLFFRIRKNNINLAEQKKLKYPLGAEVEITTGCNLRCKHCFQSDYKEEFMTLENFKNIIDILCRNKVYELNLVGGEVFHHRDAMRMIEYASSKGMTITIVTNATLISDQQIQELKKIKYLYILVSLDGNKKVHDYIRGKGMYDITVETAKKLKGNKINVEFLYTLNAVNLSVYEEVVEFAKNIDIPINFNLFKPFNKKCHEELIIIPEKFFETIEHLLYLRVRKGYKIGVSNAAITSYALGLPEKNECTASLAGVVINVSGHMLACPYLVEAGCESKDDLPLFDQNFIKVWQTGEYFENFRKHGQKNCQACSYIFSGDVCGVDPYGLEEYKKFSKKKNKEV